MIPVTDQLQRQVQLSQPPQRIISTVPSQTELLYSLGLEQQVTGITKFCVHPPHWKKTKTIIGGTKNLHLDKIKALAPYLVIANKEENLETEINELAKDFPVFVSDVTNLPSALDMIESVGRLTGTAEKATALIDIITTGFNKMETNVLPKRTAYLIWQEPYMTVGGDTFIHDMLQRCGCINVFANSLRYPQTTITELQSLEVELLLLSTEPYPFQQKHVNALQTLLPGTTIALVDGEYFSWYGSRLCAAPAYFTQLLAQLSR
jgi:ABC-type Fe3+-hydroxamate transport system substrate-binding protein